MYKNINNLYLFLHLFYDCGTAEPDGDCALQINELEKKKKIVSILTFYLTSMACFTVLVNTSYCISQSELFLSCTKIFVIVYFYRL